MRRGPERKGNAQVNIRQDYHRKVLVRIEMLLLPPLRPHAHVVHG